MSSSKASDPQDDEIFESPDDDALEDDGIGRHIPVLGMEGLEDPEMLEGDSLQEPKIDALHAFETFMGRTYDSAERLNTKSKQQLASDAELAKQAASRGAEVAALASGDSAGLPRLPEAQASASEARRDGAARSETPLQRALRLQAELAELAGDLAEAEQARAAKRTAAADPAEGTSSAGPHDTLGVLSREVSRMQASMEALQGAAARAGDAAAGQLARGSGPSSSAAAGSVLALSQGLGTAPASSAAAVGRILEDQGQDEGTDPGRGQRGGAPPSSSSFSSSSLDAAALEARLAALEQVLGGEGEGEASMGRAIAGAGAALGIAGRLSRLESQLGLLRPAALQAARGRARAAAAELKVLEAQARAAAAAVTCGDGPGAVDGAGAAVREAVGVLRRLDAQAAAVPSLLGRLRALAVLHAESAEFSGRLSAAEEAVGAVEARLAADAAAVGALREALEAAGGALEGSLRAAEGTGGEGVEGEGEGDPEGE